MHTILHTSQLSLSLLSLTKLLGFFFFFALQNLQLSHLIRRKKKEIVIMGNCMEICLLQREEELEDEIVHEQKMEGEIVKAKENVVEKNNIMRMKMVLSKEELESLLVQLKHNEGKNLEELLGEIEMERRRKENNTSDSKWKPSLESIIESPEIQEMMDRS